MEIILSLYIAQLKLILDFGKQHKNKAENRKELTLACIRTVSRTGTREELGFPLSSGKQARQIQIQNESKVFKPGRTTK